MLCHGPREPIFSDRAQQMEISFILSRILKYKMLAKAQRQL
jgi:hypothetical protein